MFTHSLARDRKSKPKWCTESTLCKCTGLFLVAGCIAGIIVWFAVFNGSTIGNSNGGSDSNNPNIPGTDTYDQTCADVSADKCARLQLEGNTLEEALEATSMSKETR
ncbi:hypothetical protein SARC_17771 [Sphaeroforma arctica JP610]|uniref:Uncharacterized protein n=1 Tax=Sphaeroforma arctica JP610 TaxID=667725 RepID=A0A0L0EZ97_9EUKA|nr:hypothetical protein SARC_17771 [Sphaeroforma arctica JP610]KNC69714.1 hypothetical protein SARC_17771 [Sphaeroforma arctica JP610]|eukprot:XP_014143616.1 hypothetical protein SARC_17771 [Sphaeroforma arctica JP610]